MTKDFYNNGTILYNTVNQKSWIIFYSKFDESLKDWVYLLVMSDNIEFVVLGKDTKVTGEYITDKINNGKIIMNFKP
jgi:hypothetical protein